MNAFTITSPNYPQQTLSFLDALDFVEVATPGFYKIEVANGGSAVEFTLQYGHKPPSNGIEELRQAWEDAVELRSDVLSWLVNSRKE